MSHVFPSVFPIFSPCFCPIHSARGGPATSRKLRISKPLGPRRRLWDRPSENEKFVLHDIPILSCESWRTH
jgi:hypothetical protein